MEYPDWLTEKIAKAENLEAELQKEDNRYEAFYTEMNAVLDSPSPPSPARLAELQLRLGVHTSSKKGFTSLKQILKAYRKKLRDYRRRHYEMIILRSEVIVDKAVLMEKEIASRYQEAADLLRDSAETLELAKGTLHEARSLEAYARAVAAETKLRSTLVAARVTVKMTQRDLEARKQELASLTD